MSGGRLQRKLLIALAASLLATPSLGQQKFRAQRQLQSPATSQAMQASVLLPPEQMPASPPEVQFQQGQLTIMASNSTLGDILRAVRKETGASVDVPGNATERVVGQFGPGPARDVLASLLNGSHFNYLLLGSAENPVGLDRVILTSRSGANEQEAQQANTSMPQIQPNQAAMIAPQPADIDETSTDDSDTSDTADADDQGNPAQPDDQQPQQPNALGQQGVKTPEQLLQELQQRQLQVQQQVQQQIQQQGNPNAPTYPPTPGLPRQPQ